jgi:hypothetical protein
LTFPNSEISISKFAILADEINSSNIRNFMMNFAGTPGVEVGKFIVGELKCWGRNGTDPTTQPHLA